MLMDLKRAQLGVRRMVRCIETCVIEWLGLLGISAYGKPSAPGVYAVTGNVEAKIAALGLRVRNGCTYHGLSVNVAMNLSPFADIDPCGYPGLVVTQLADFDVVRTVDEAGAELAPMLASRLASQAST
jgi:lipoyl(octanoyl) transferase